MSKTYRKRRGRPTWSSNEESARTEYVRAEDFHKLKSTDIEWYELRDSWFSYEYHVTYSKHSKMGKKLLAKYHSDAGTHDCREPGPKAHKKVTTLRPYRRKYKALAKRAVHEDIEIVVETIRYPYWT